MARRKAIVDFEIKGQSGLTSIKHLEDRVRMLRKEWRHTEDAVARYKKELEFQAANEELRRHRQRVNDTETSWQKFKKTVGPIATGVLGANILSWATGLATQAIPALIGGSAKLADELADIQKNTGLLKSEVKELNSDLKTINTRSSRSELRALASEAGKLGKTTKADIMEFVREANMINVALGEDLGEGATREIGKLADVFQTSMLQIGSSINTVGANSAASEPYLVNFLSRLGGAAATVDLSAPSVIGYGAVLDSLGLQVEMSSTALSNFFIDFVKDSAKFEKAAGMQKGALDKLIGEKGTNEGFLSYIETLQAASKDEADFLKRLEDIGIDGSRGAAVFLTLANNTEMVRQQQSLANQAYESGTSIIDEFNVKNNNAAAILDKVGKWWDSFWTSGALRDNIDDMITKFAKLVGVVSEADLKSQKFFEKRSEIEKYEQSLIPLIARYEQLRVKSNKTSEEQDELKTIIGQIAGIVPSAITEVDKYGNALAISAGKAREFVEQQKSMLRYLNKESLKEIGTELSSIEKEFGQINKQIASGFKLEMDYIGIGGKIQKKKLTPEELAALRSRQAELGARRKELEQVQKGLSGEFDIPTTTGGPTTDSGASGTSGGIGSNTATNQLTKEDSGTKALRKKLDDQHKALEDALAKQRQALAKFRDEEYENNLSAADREIVLIMQKYDKIIEESGVKGKELEDLQKQQAEEIRLAMDQQKFNQVESSFAEAERLLKEQHEAAMFALDLRAAAEFDKQEEINLLKLEQERMFLEKKLLLESAYSGNTEKLHEDLANKIKEIEILKVSQAADATEKEIQLKRDVVDAEEDLKISKMSLYEAGAAALKNLFKETSGAYKAMFLLEKAFTISQMIMAHRREVAMIRSTAPPIVSDALVVKSHIQFGIALAQIVGQVFGQITKKEKGGFTDRQSLGYTSGAALYGGPGNPFIAGEKGIEFVTSNHSLQNPLVADFTRALDAAQKTGDYSNLKNFGTNDKLSAEMVMEIKKLNENFTRFAGMPVNFNIDHFERATDFLYEIRASVTA